MIKVIRKLMAIPFGLAVIASGLICLLFLFAGMTVNQGPRIAVKRCRVICRDLGRFIAEIEK